MISSAACPTASCRMTCCVQQRHMSDRRRAVEIQGDTEAAYIIIKSETMTNFQKKQP